MRSRIALVTDWILPGTAAGTASGEVTVILYYEIETYNGMTLTSERYRVKESGEPLIRTLHRRPEEPDAN